MSSTPKKNGVVIKQIADAPWRRILAVALPGLLSPASEAFLGLLEHYAAAYPRLAARV